MFQSFVYTIPYDIRANSGRQVVHICVAMAANGSCVSNSIE